MIILELIGHPVHMSTIREKLFLPPSFSFEHANSYISTSHDPSPEIPLKAQAHLKADNGPDIALYREFRERAECGIRNEEGRRRIGI